MKTNSNENIYVCDVDDTLVLERRPRTAFEERNQIVIRNPYDGCFKNRIVHTRHVELIKMMKGRGRYIRVHSGNGGLWADAVVKALGLEDFVDDCETKPIGYIDDMPVETWMKNHIYLTPEGDERE
jgi:hypothetical protein